MTSFTINHLNMAYSAQLFLIQVFVCCLVGDLAIAEEFVYSQNLVDRSVQEDAVLPLTKLVNKYGYPAEAHTVRTEDGYLLTVYRIPFGKKCGPDSGNKIPVLLQHGLLSSAFDFVITGPKKALGYLLADKCYDVWLGNNRGNSESKKHVTLNPRQKEFWQFTWHEMGKYDLPALIDYILNVTKHSSLHYVGHSQGTTQFFVFGSLYPQYHKKIRSMQALSPVAYMKNFASPFLKVATIFYEAAEVMAEMVGMHEFLPNNIFLNLIGSNLCQNQFPNIQIICTNVFFLLCGYDEPQLNKTILPAIIGHTPAGASSKQLVHFAQGIKSGLFRQFDFGILKNLFVYKSFTPPEYDISKIHIPIGLYYGPNDWLAPIKDVKQLKKRLPNIVENYQVPYSKFNHVDFLYASDVKVLLYNRLMEILQKYD